MSAVGRKADTALTCRDVRFDPSQTWHPWSGPPEIGETEVDEKSETDLPEMEPCIGEASG